jgi:hypothetical protein
MEVNGSLNNSGILASPKSTPFKMPRTAMPKKALAKNTVPINVLVTCQARNLLKLSLKDEKSKSLGRIYLSQKIE